MKLKEKEKKAGKWIIQIVIGIVLVYLLYCFKEAL